MGKDDGTASLDRGCNQDEGDTQSAEEISSLGSPCAQVTNDSIQPWARLVSVQKTYRNIDIWEDEASIGRMDAEGDKRVSKIHFKIQRDASSGNAVFCNFSAKGTLVNGHLLIQNAVTSLEHGDCIVLGPHASGYPTYILQMLDRNQQSQKKRPYQVFNRDSSNGANSKSAPDDNEPHEKRMKDMQNFGCGICLNIWHDVVSLVPCLHNFCNGCFSDWYKTFRNQRCTCPKCRAPIVSVGRNHTLNNLLEDFLKENPLLRRPTEDTASLDAKAIVTSNHMRLVDGDGSDVSNNHSDDESEERCPQCPRQDNLQGGLDNSNSTGFHCGQETVHLTCSACSALMPERIDLNIPQKCAGCDQIFCDAYWRSQNISGRNGVTISCISSGSLRPVTRQYMAEQSLAIQDLVRDWLNKLDTSEVEQPRFPGNPHALVTSASYVCNACADSVIHHLLYKFRLSVPRTELPPDAAGREDCWYGHFCRTQLHKGSHARKFNHACEPSRMAREN
eukprot:c26401_g1_i2 orf=154-1665(-)